MSKATTAKKQQAARKRQRRPTTKSEQEGKPQTHDKALQPGALEPGPTEPAGETSSQNGQAAEPARADNSLLSSPEGDDQLGGFHEEMGESVAGPEAVFSSGGGRHERVDPAGAPVEQRSNLYLVDTAGGGRQTAEASEPAAVPPADSHGTLIAHCGTRKITREELSLIPVPEATRTHQPIAHHRIIESLIEALSFRHITVVREEYAVSPDGGKMFGVLDLNTEWNGVRFSVGLRNSNDKSMRLGMTVGYRVTVCDNMMFKGDFTPVLYKHTRKLDLLDVISVGVDRMQRSFAPLRTQIQGWLEYPVTDEQAKLLIYRAFLEDRFPRLIMPEVHRCYFKPDYEEFKPRTLWSLSNAFTSAFKLLKPMRQFTATAKLGQYLEKHINGQAQLAA